MTSTLGETWSRRDHHARGKNTRRVLRPLAALAMVALISAGCSNSVAPTGTGRGGGANNATDRDQAVKFAECMRANGVREFPDPDASGHLAIDQVANRSSVDTNSAAFQQAISVCKDLEPPGFTGAKRTPEQQKAALKFAQCIRDNGVKDFPDPAPDAHDRHGSDPLRRNDGRSGAPPRRDAEVSRSRGRCRRLGGPMKRKTWVLGGGAVLVAVAAIGGGAVVFGAKQAAPAADEPPANTAKVQRGNLSAMVSVDGTLTYQARSDGSPAVVAAGCS